MTSILFQDVSQINASVPLKNIQDVFEHLDTSAGDMLLVTAAAVQPQSQGHVGLLSQQQQQQQQIYGLNVFPLEYSQLADYNPLNTKSSSLTAPDPAVTAPAATAASGAAVDPPPGAGNQEQIAALVNSREKEVTELQATLAVPLAAFNAKFIWHCIMNIERDCEPAFVEKIKNIHRTFYLPPAIAFYTLWLHFRFWHQLRQVYFTVEALLPTPTASTATLNKEARVSLMLYMLAASFANKHLDDFSYRNSSWYEAAHLTPSAFLQMELLALQELQWSLEISAKDWSNWLLHLRTSNITLERTRPTTQTYHFVVARLIQDAILEAGLEKEELVRMGISPILHDREIYGRLSFGMGPNGSVDMKKAAWNETSPTLVASSQGASPVAAEGFLHTRVNVNPAGNKNIADGPYGLHALQRKLENVQREAILNPRSEIKYIPWDTSLDPVVHVNGFGSRSRSGSASANLNVNVGRSNDSMKGVGMGNACFYETTGLGGYGPARHASFSQWGPRPMDPYAYQGVGVGAVTTCADVLGRGGCTGYDYSGAKPLDYAGATAPGFKGMRPLKTCNTVGLAQGQGFDNYPTFDPALFPTSWAMRL